MIALLLALATPAYAADCRPSLGSVMAYLTPRIEAESLGNGEYILTTYERQERVAVLSYRIMPDGTLSLDFAATIEGHERQGHNHRLWREIMARHPEVREVESTLMSDNLDAYHQAEREAQAAGTSLACAALVVATPAYRVRRASGFTRVLYCSPGRGGIVLRMGR